MRGLEGFSGGYGYGYQSEESKTEGVQNFEDAENICVFERRFFDLGMEFGTVDGDLEQSPKGGETIMQDGIQEDGEDEQACIIPTLAQVPGPTVEVVLEECDTLEVHEEIKAKTKGKGTKRAFLLAFLGSLLSILRIVSLFIELPALFGVLESGVGVLDSDNSTTTVVESLVYEFEAADDDDTGVEVEEEKEGEEKMESEDEEKLGLLDWVEGILGYHVSAVDRDPVAKILEDRVVNGRGLSDERDGVGKAEEDIGTKKTVLNWIDAVLGWSDSDLSE